MRARGSLRLPRAESHAMAAHPNLGFGIGLRTGHFGGLLERGTGADWLEAISENFMIAGGRPLHVLERVRREKPLVLHGVSLSIGGTDPLDDAYLRELRALADRFEPAWVSDHLCWTTHDAHQLHELLPLPWTGELLEHLVPRIARVQDALGRRLVLENVSTYLAFEGEMTEWEFLAELVHRADCDLLLDVNNVHVSAYNHGFDARRYLDAIPTGRVAQIHLAGHSDHGTHLLDSHDAPVADAVWDLYRHAVARFGPVSTLVEWDGDVPPLEVVEAEALRARRAAVDVHASRRRDETDVAAA